MKVIVICALLALAACSGNAHKLPHTSSFDPVWAINPDKWTGNTVGPTQQVGELSRGQ